MHIVVITIMIWACKEKFESAEESRFFSSYKKT